MADIIARGPAQLYDVQSLSGKSLTYRVVVGYESPDDDTCTCPAFFYRTQRAMGPDTIGCKHIGWVRSERELEADEPTVGRPVAPGGIVELLEDAFTRGMELGRKFGAVYGK